ncbi:DUF4921 family protein [Janibacter sp. GXQ6167]|uniref:DUF4921 family protein n=1 Tax=Janibacter sp. GXQ6167 TaxID=3240791 RepID=UPI003523ADA6
MSHEPSVPWAGPHLTRMADGTVKQVNPFTGTQVWTVPGRANRPLAPPREARERLDPAQDGRWCAFCSRRYLETTPERRRIVRRGERFTALDGVPAERLFDTLAEFRVFPNLFEIVSYEYWRLNHGYEPTPAAQRRHRAYLASSAGRAHLDALVRTRMRAAGERPEDWDGQDLGERTMGLFAGCHDVVVARRHYVDGAAYDDELASSGTLTPDEHDQYIGLTIHALEHLYAANPYARQVSVFQNWLRPAGASFDHLHKQLVAVDDHGPDLQVQIDRLRSEPNLYDRWGPRYAATHDLVIARNQHAVMTAGVGHRYPAIEVWSSVPGRPWELSQQVRRDFSDLLHAAHAATGSAVPCNEEWHHQPRDVAEDMPLRAVLKWRISTLAGFEGGTRIYLNTIDPWTLRDRVARRLRELQRQGSLGDLDIAR